VSGSRCGTRPPSTTVDRACGGQSNTTLVNFTLIGTGHQEDYPCSNCEGDSGVELEDDAAFVDFTIDDNGKHGAELDDGATGVDSTVENNTMGGVFADDGARLRNVVAECNRNNSGIVIDEDGTLREVTARENNGSGVVVGVRGDLEDVTAIDNNLTGSEVASGVLTDATVAYNGDGGIKAGSVRLRNLTANGNGEYGVTTGSGATVGNVTVKTAVEAGSSNSAGKAKFKNVNATAYRDSGLEGRGGESVVVNNSTLRDGGTGVDVRGAANAGAR
jgi:hypothetical protein